MLPPPGWFYDALKIQLIDAEPVTSDTREEETNDKEKDVILHDTYMYLKMVFVFTVYLIFAVAQALLFLFIWFAHTDFSTYDNQALASYLQTFNIRDDQVIQFIKAWYISIFVFGWLIWNGIRVGIIALLAPQEARSKFEFMVNGEQEEQPQGWIGCLFGWLWWFITLPFKLVVWIIKFLAEFFHNRWRMCCNCGVLISWLSYTWRTLIFIPRDSVEVGIDVLAAIRLLKHSNVAVSTELVNMHRTTC